MASRSRADEKRTEKKAPKADKQLVKPDKQPAGAGKGEKGAKADKPVKAQPPVERAQVADQPHQPARLKVAYAKEIAPALTQQFGYTSPMQVPRISKITLNMGVGEA